MPDNPTLDEIIRDAEARIAQLDALIERVNAEMNRIRVAAGGNPSAAERAELRELNRYRQTLSKSIRRVALVSLERLDATDELRRIVTALAAVRVGLEERRSRIERFAESAQQFAAILDGIGRLAVGIDGAGTNLRGRRQPPGCGHGQVRSSPGRCRRRPWPRRPR